MKPLFESAPRSEQASSSSHRPRLIRPRQPRRLLRSAQVGQVAPATEPPLVVAPEAQTPVNAAPRGDALQLYLREIGQVKLLTPPEEIALSKLVQRGDEAARERMIKANLRLVVKIARDYEGLGLPLLDLVNEGNIGLMKGVERFDPGKGAKLSTYAAWWIKQGIKRALANQSKTIRLPVHVVDKMAHIHQAERKLRDAFDRDATDEEVAAEMGFSLRQVKLYREA